MINWREIAVVGTPTNPYGKYLVTDGEDISVSGVTGITTYKGETRTFNFSGWDGDENTYEDNQCCAGERIFDLVPTHWCPIEEINLPERKLN